MQSTSDKGRKPHIVLVVLDTHRWDRLGCYGYPRATSPNLDAFAEQAILFERAIAPGQWTIPSHASMFSGEPPNVHRALQSDDVLHERFTTLAEHLRAAGYRTTGFCNNPLVGVLDNGLRRGFDAFYNYGGAFPLGFDSAEPSGPLQRAWRAVDRRLRIVVQPIQNAFARSATLFQGALDPFWVPIWTGIANFKGNTSRSVRDVARFVERRFDGREGEPQFLFVNLMETHLPYTPPARFAQALAPSYAEAGEGRDFIEDFNRRAADWFTPPLEPFSASERQVLGEMYDAEVAYQDHLLGGLLEVLDRPERRDDTLVIFVGDHGEMLGEHRLMGHAFGVYEELIHVPLMIRVPGQRRGERVGRPVSTTRLFHTVLHGAGVESVEDVAGQRVEVGTLSLKSVNGQGEPKPPVICEAYAPTFAVQVMEAHKQALMDELHCRATCRAAYEGMHKLIAVEGVGEALFSLGRDPGERRSLDDEASQEKRWQLVGRIASFLERGEARRPGLEAERASNVDDAVVQMRLRDLGYLE